MEGRDTNVIKRAELIKKVLCEIRVLDRNYNEVDCDEVYPGIFIGDECSARNRNSLKSFGITHIVNAASGKRFGMVNTGASYYADLNINYLGIELSDFSFSDASKYFYDTANFIEEALKNNGKVLVHCLMGISRSSTLVLAFLMLKRDLSAEEAVAKVRRRRNIHPNDGFIRQLAELDISLARIRARNQKDSDTQ